MIPCSSFISILPLIVLSLLFFYYHSKNNISSNPSIYPHPKFTFRSPFLLQRGESIASHLVWILCYFARSLRSFLLQSSLPYFTVEIVVVGRSRFRWLRACSNAPFAPRDPPSATYPISLPMLAQKVIFLICTNFKSAVIKKLLLAMSLQRMTDGTSSMVLEDCYPNVCCRRNPRRVIEEAERRLSATSKMIPISKIVILAYQLR